MSQTRRIGQYEIREQLGEGGSGRVDIAHDTVLDRLVAIKSLRPELLHDKSFVERFRTEAKNLARLSHPNITTLYTLIEDSGCLYMVMELVRGRTLEAIIEDCASPLSVEEALAIVAQASDGLAYAHEKGVVHRDIKPGNMILTDSGLLKIMDFGIARAQGSQRQTRDGSAIGTAAYMSPEQCHGSDVDGRTDQYGLAIVLYELLTGSPPFSAPSFLAVMEAQVKNAPEPPSRRVSGIPPHVEQALMKALSKKPEDRFASLTAFKNAVGAPASRTEAVNIVHAATRLVEAPRQPLSASTLWAAAKRMFSDLANLRLPWVVRGVAIGAAVALVVAATLFFIKPTPPAPGPATADLSTGSTIRGTVSQIKARSQNPYFLTRTDSKPSQGPPGGGKTLSGGGRQPPFDVAAEPNGQSPAAHAAEEPGRAAGDPAPSPSASDPKPATPGPQARAGPEEHRISAKEVEAAYEAKDFAAAREKAEPCAKEGDFECQFILGRLFESGLGGVQNPSAAADWYRKAAEAGFAKACYNLGVLYYSGTGVPRDPRMAAEWFSKAAYQKHASAQFNLARLYEIGEGVPKDHALARHWYTEVTKSSDVQLAARAQEALDKLGARRQR